jgi:hypothetical protein
MEKLSKGILSFFDYKHEKIDLNLQTAVFRREDLKLYRGTDDADHMIMLYFFKPFYRALLVRTS